MAEIPQATAHETVDMIYRGLERKLRSKFRLTRIGASSIGTECLRAIWYDWRGYSTTEFDGRVLRLFQTGHLQEDRIVEDLKHAGFQVWEKDPSTDQQWTHNDESGHFVVKLDGVIRGLPGCEKTPHVLEIKTHNKKSFEELQKFGVQRAKPVHYDQMHSGMIFAGIDRALYVALCKDDERYHVERIVLDEDHAKKLQQKIITIRTATTPPTRLGTTKETFGCKWCDHKAVCWDGAPANRTCRACEHSEAIDGGVWACGLLKTELTPDAQLRACEHYSEIGK